MKRFHIHVSVDDLDTAIRFYSAIFGIGPAVAKPDYAKWMLDDPCVNFAISNRSRTVGVNHLGIQADSDDELSAVRQRLQAAGAVTAQIGASCCYARSDKYWIADPVGIAWEAFRSLGDAPTYNGESQTTSDTCCIPIAHPSDDADKKSVPCCV